MVRLRILVAALLMCGCLPLTAQATEQVRLNAGFTPDKLGAPTTIRFGFTVSATNGGIPSPLTDVNLHLPAGINPATATLGDGECAGASLLGHGLQGCPQNAELGHGQALAAVTIGPEPIRETATVTVVNGPPDGHHLVLLFYAEGKTPVEAELVFPAEIFLNQEGPFSGHIETNIPPIESVPGAPDVSVLHFQSTLGPLGVTYYRTVHGRREAFHPEGIAVPESCPHGGFLFSGNFTFMDGTTVTANSAVPCPSSRHHRHRSIKRETQGQRE